MNGQSATISDDLWREIMVLQKAVEKLKEKVLAAMPMKYGSEAWWEKNNKEALEQIERGEFIEVHNNKELKKYLGV